MTVLKLDTDSVQALHEAIQSVFVAHDAPLPDNAHITVTVNLRGNRELFDALTAGVQTRDYVDADTPFRAATLHGRHTATNSYVGQPYDTSITLLADLTVDEAVAVFMTKHGASHV